MNIKMENKPNKKRDTEGTIFMALGIISMFVSCIISVNFILERWGSKPLYAIMTLLFAVFFFMASYQIFKNNHED
jgi:fatty acid desaturase